MRIVIQLTFALLVTLPAIAQPDRWQQKVNYQMDITLDVKAHQFTGKQKLTYTNNSPDTLTQVFYHLYFNAFQPGSMMDVRSQNLPDPDRRVRDRISKLGDDEIGYHKISSLLQNGKPTEFVIEGTVLEVKLPEPIPPNSQTVFEMEFNAQVPKQIRRSGYLNSEGIEFSMSQWYPKMAEYDYKGWHAHPYIAREFYAPWGDFEVNITLDKDYIIGATGVLQNPEEIGYGYGEKTVKTKGKTLTWKFKAENVHDFVWAADPDYTHDKITVEGGPEIHFLYQPKNSDIIANWKKLQEEIKKAYPYMEKTFGKYPYEVYSVIQGGDGGMEYPMATLITGERSYESLLGVTLHEMMHTWYQMILATNESYYAWMDEGYTTYAEALTMQYLNGGDEISGLYNAYLRLVQSGNEEPLSTHSDHFDTNRAYSLGSYIKGAVSLHQLGYIIGQDVMMKGLLTYYNTWKFKHPNLNDFVRIMEKESGLELDWYYEYWINTTHTIDYAVSEVKAVDGGTSITLSRVGRMPMPLDIEVTYTDGKKELIYIPLRIMRGEKPNESDLTRTQLPDWPWTHPNYSFKLDKPLKSIQSINIDPSGRMADINRKNNVYKK